MQVRSSPRKSRAKEPAAKKTKKQRTEIPSTNVSSPIRAPKQKIRQYAYNGDYDDEDDAFDVPRHPTHKQRAHGFEVDDFVANDDDIDGDFPPIRVARPSKSAKSKALGHPITTDERVDELNDEQQCTFIDFMTGARKLRREIMAEKGHREPIFNDTVLQEMGLELPTDVDEMQVIPGIRPEMVNRYGKRFLPLVRNSRELYRGNVPGRRHLPLRQYTLHQVDDAEHEEDEVLDPNHQNIIDLCSDDEAAIVAEDFESNYFDSDEDDDDDGEMHISHHFTQHVDPEVIAFNHRMTQLGPAVPKTTNTTRTLATRGGSKASNAKKGKAPRRNGSGSFGKSYAGVKKRATKGSTGRASGSTGAAKKAVGNSRQGGGNSGGGTLAAPWSSIMAMPT
jgi:bloom syndrome protein